MKYLYYYILFFYLLFYKQFLEIYGFISCASYLLPIYANKAKLSEDNYYSC